MSAQHEPQAEPNPFAAIIDRARAAAADPRHQEVLRLIGGEAWEQLCPEGDCLAGETRLGVGCPLWQQPQCHRQARLSELRVQSQLRAAGIPERYLRDWPQWGRVPADIRGAARAYCDDLGNRVIAGRGLLVMGDRGAGKTALLALVAAAAVEARVRVAYVATGGKLADAIMGHAVRQQEEPFTTYRRAGLLLVDDLDRVFSRNGQDGENRMLARVDEFFDERYGDLLATCVATNANAEALKQQPELARALDRWRECMTALGTRAGSQRQAYNT